jgi:hypothetical protein
MKILRKHRRITQRKSRGNYFLQIADTKGGFRIYVKGYQDRGSSVELTEKQAFAVADYINTRVAK